VVITGTGLTTKHLSSTKHQNSLTLTSSPKL